MEDDDRQYQQIVTRAHISGNNCVLSNCKKCGWNHKIQQFSNICWENEDLEKYSQKTKSTFVQQMAKWRRDEEHNSVG